VDARLERAMDSRKHRGGAGSGDQVIDAGRQARRVELGHEPMVTDTPGRRRHPEPAPDRRPGPSPDVGSSEPFEISLASAAQRESIYRMRHAVYAVELGQHPVNPAGQLTDALDAFNHYLVLTRGGRLVGFVSITPPGHGRYSVDKYIPRAELPFDVDDGLFEVRVLTVEPTARGSAAAGLLMYAALRWVEEHGGNRIVIIGRSEVAGLYERVGMCRLGRSFQSGAVTYELMTATTGEIRQAASAFAGLLHRLAPQVDWRLTIPFEPQRGAYHGGASHEVLGASPAPDRRAAVTAADVLDAWFPPTPGVRRALCDDPDFVSMTSPPARPGELHAAIAGRNGVAAESVVVGAGLSDLIYRCLPRWLDRSSRVILVEPQYGEYRHVLQGIVGCHVEAVWFDPSEDTIEPVIPEMLMEGGYDWAFLVDPNNPLGYRFDPEGLADELARVPASTRIWVDRTYAPYAGRDTTLERLAASSSNIVVGMSMSKAWALSGLRVGYLCGPRSLVDDAMRATPPWCISRPAQAAALAAIADPDYYERRYEETTILRDELWTGLAAIPGLHPRRGVANFLFCWLEEPLDAATIVEACARQGVFLRAFPAEPALRDRALRVAVRDADAQRRILHTIAEAVDEVQRSRAAVDGQPLTT